MSRLRTKRELATEVLKRSGIVGAAEEPSDEDFRRVLTVYETKLEEWRDRNMIYWASSDDWTTQEIPAACFDTLVDLMINAGSRQFGRDANTSILDRRMIENQLLKSLRRHTRMQTARRPAPADYF